MFNIQETCQTFFNPQESKEDLEWLIINQHLNSQDIDSAIFQNKKDLANKLSILSRYYYAKKDDVKQNLKHRLTDQGIDWTKDGYFKDENIIPETWDNEFIEETDQHINDDVDHINYPEEIKEGFKLL